MALADPPPRTGIIIETNPLSRVATIPHANNSALTATIPFREGTSD
jgi:hypothetical protein